MPIRNPDTVSSLLDIAAPLARDRGGRVVALAVVEVPRQLPIHEGLSFAGRKEGLFSQAREYAAADRH